jgi:hypothetical protein
MFALIALELVGDPEQRAEDGGAVVCARGRDHPGRQPGCATDGPEELFATGRVLNPATSMVLLALAISSTLLRFDTPLRN